MQEEAAKGGSWRWQEARPLQGLAVEEGGLRGVHPKLWNLPSELLNMLAIPC